MNKISRKGFLKIAAAAAMSGVTAGALAACNAASGSTSTAASGSAAASGATGTYIPGTYEGTAEGISSTVKVTMTFSDSAVTDVVVDTSGETASFGAAAADELREQLLSAGSAEIDGVSGSTITSDAVMKAAKSCYAQAKGEAVVSSVQLPTGDANDWLGKEPDIDETAITETVDTDILIVGAGNGGMFAAAYAAANGLNFRVIEQNANVQDTRHWYGAIDSAAAKAAGEQPADRAKLLSEISRYASGKCDQRVVKTWINESAAMHDFVSGILENEPYNYVCNLTAGDEAKWPDDTQVSQSKLMFPVQQVDYSSAEKPRNVVFQEYIESKGYSIDFNTGLAKLVVSCQTVNAEILSFGVETAQIDLKTYEGIRIDKAALHIVDGQRGVYVKYGNLQRFLKIETLYEDENYILIPDNGKLGTDNEVRLYDEIIVQGTNLQDGKLL